jgi:hypothetical protein
METLNAQAIMESQALTRLKHIQLELESNPMGRIEDLRRFADTWYCYTHGFVTRSLKADWHKIDFNRELTEGIVELIEEHTISGLKKMKSKLYVKKEHVIPIGVIEQKLLELGNKVSLEDIAKVLNENLIYATISKAEDAMLRDKNTAGGNLSSKMPAEYYDKDHELYGDPFARYKIKGIKIVSPLNCS